MATWMVATKDGKRVGPVSDSQLLAMAKSGQIDAETLVRKEGMQGWAKASQVKGLLTPRTPAAAAVPTVSARPVPPPVAKPVRSSVAAPAAMAAAYAAKPAANNVPSNQEAQVDWQGASVSGTEGGKFGVSPYKADGKFTIGGMLVSLLLITVGGVILGALAHYIGRFYYLIFLFPVLIGLGVGYFGRIGVKLSKIRNKAIGACLGIVGGLVAILVIHQLDYFQFRSELSKELWTQPALRKVLIMSDAEREQFVAENDYTAEEREDLDFTVKAYKADNLFKYLDLEAQIGVTITGRAGQKNGINLGYVGTCVYWLLEAVVVAVLTTMMVGKQTSRPFCTKCGVWKVQTQIGSFTAQPINAQSAVLSGDIQSWATTGFNVSKTGQARVAFAKCPMCKDRPFEVCLSQVKPGKKEKPEEMVVVTYPPEAQAAIRSLLASPASAEETPTVVTVS